MLFYFGIAVFNQCILLINIKTIYLLSTAKILLKKIVLTKYYILQQRFLIKKLQRLVQTHHLVLLL